jgi:hypothetical protein
MLNTHVFLGVLVIKTQLDWNSFTKIKKPFNTKLIFSEIIYAESITFVIQLCTFSEFLMNTI